MHAGRVVLPLDLLQYEPHVAPAVQRAFGGYVIAVDAPTAALLVQRWGLSSVTLQGSTSHK